MKLAKLLISLALVFWATAITAAEHRVKMKNIGEDGSLMVFEPAVLEVAVGDKVLFIPTDPAHNSESVAGLVPEGATAWHGAIDELVSVTIDTEGVYVYQCLPHIAMAMVGVIVAGEPTNLDEVKRDAAALSAKFFANKDRLNTYLDSVQ